MRTERRTDSPGGAAIRQRLLQTLGLHSLLGRYLHVVGITVLLLAAAAWITDRHVGDAVRENTANQSEHRQLSDQIRDLGNDLEDCQLTFQSYLLAPDGRQRRAIQDLLGRLVADAGTLAGNERLQRSAYSREVAAQLHQDLTKLSAEVRRALDIRGDPQRLFPTMAILTTRMAPAAAEFYDAATRALDEARGARADGERLGVTERFSEARHVLTLMTNANRLWVAKGFVALDDAKHAARARADEVKPHAELLGNHLEALASLERQGRLSPRQGESLRIMQRAYRDWLQRYRELRAIDASGGGRADQALLRGTIQPLFMRASQALRVFERDTETDSARNIETLERVAERVSNNLWVFVLLVLLGSAGGAAVFAFHIRRPLARVAQALKSEAESAQDLPVLATPTVEIRDLVEAFRHMREQVRTRQERLAAVLTYAADAIVTIDEDGLIEGFNPAAEKLFGYPASEVLGQNVKLLMPEPHRSQHDGYIGRYLETGKKCLLGQEREVVGLRKDGIPLPIGLRVTEMHVNGRRLFLGMIADISERKALLQNVQMREQRMRTILDTTAEGIVTFNERGQIETWNKAAERLFGWTEAEIIGTSIARIVSPESRENRGDYVEHFMRSEIQRLVGHEGEVIGLHQNGSTFALALKIGRMEFEGKTKYTALLANITERKSMMENLRRMAEHDGLTGLYNRTYFLAELERLVERVKRNEKNTCALLYLDLDNFKYVNDTLGHAAGDQLLIEVAGVLSRRGRKSDLVARLGGDEFIILVYDIAPDLVDKVAESFRHHLADYAFQHEGKAVAIGCSIGVAVMDARTQSPTEAMSQADLACHLAKRAGRNSVHVFSAADAKDVQIMSLDMGWSRRIREAIEKDRFVLATQPVVHTRTRAVACHEILVRLREDDGALIMPGGFLPTAERFGLSVEIDRWVIRHAIALLAERRRRDPTMRFAINLSAQSLGAPAVADLVTQCIAENGVDAAALTFEVTETAAIADMNTATAFLMRLRTLGCLVALDDFGSGMASFAYLRELPVDYVKIDGRFVRNLIASPVDQAMVRAMNDIAHALGKETIAEFVESEEDFRLLGEIGVDYGQGYHLGKPALTEPEAARAAPMREVS